MPFTENRRRRCPCHSRKHASHKEATKRRILLLRQLNWEGVRCFHCAYLAADILLLLRWLYFNLLSRGHCSHVYFQQKMQFSTELSGTKWEWLLSKSHSVRERSTNGLTVNSLPSTISITQANRIRVLDFLSYSGQLWQFCHLCEKIARATV